MLVVPDQLKQKFFSVSFQDWIFLNLCFHERVQDRGTTWSSLFGLIAWRIWKNRNLFIFQNISWDAMEVVKVSSCWARQYETYIVVGDSGFAASGGVIQDFNGKWIMGSTRFLGVCSPFEAELWGILDGILILLNKGYRRAIIMTDNLEVAQNLEDLDLEDSGITVLSRTQQILRSEGEWKIKHIARDLNLIADRLAKLGLNWKTSLQVLNQVPKEVKDLLQADSINNWLMNL
ncbi:hypothetical protein J1N35_030439 [Gossypium stocksii]|uniref:RNase H type-1 domain-containing protein n=1 Tax=Gossypium stocksii TaxID=47602 RepID=A0A9D3ZU52_9ROSI|nr:hypothetical protein J1N35_030439 [Gossypium stocksii]